MTPGARFHTYGKVQVVQVHLPGKISKITFIWQNFTLEAKLVTFLRKSDFSIFCV